MAYSTSTQVMSIVDTDMSSSEVEDLIKVVDAFMDLQLDTGSLGVLVLQGISQAWAAFRVMLKDPNAERIGDISSDRGVALKLLKVEYEELLDMAAASSGLAFLVGKAAYVGC